MPFPRKFLNDGEDVVLDLHPHWWFLVPRIGAVVAAVVAAIAAAEYGDSHHYLLYAALALVAISLLWLAIRYTVYATNNFVLTTDRIIYRHGVLSKHGHEIPLDRVNDLSVSQSFFERIIGAGDVMIESAGERGQEAFTDLPKPVAVQNAIYTEIERFQDRAAGRAGGQRQLSVPEQIEKLDELRQRGIISQAEFDAKKTQLLERM